MTPTRRQTLALMAGAFAAPGVLRAQTTYVGSPFLAPDQSAGTLPPVEDRLPTHPRVMNMGAMGRTPGRHGGRLRILIGGQRDIRYVPIDSYARLVGYDADLTLNPDILERYEVEDERRFTFHLRAGHRWSDGNLLTAEDFRYAWEDCALNTDMFPGGAPPEMRVGGEVPTFEVIDALTVRYAWTRPNPEFLDLLAAPVPMRIVLPSAYLKQFHATYQTPEQLAVDIKKQRVDDWVALHMKMSRQNRPENPDLPTLEAWMPRTAPPSEQFVFTRNPYFHRVDENGLQLPYVDRLELNISSPDIIPAKTGAGDSDLQFTNIDFADYVYFKEAEKRFPVKVLLWKQTRGSRVAVIPNLNCNDPVWRDVMRDVRVRRALSLATDRHEINMAVFFGLAKEGNDTVIPESPLWRPELSALWAEYDPEQAANLLDQAGLRRPDGKPRALRRLPDGRKMQIIVETAGESSLQTDVLSLMSDHWARIGVQLLIRTSQRDIFRSRILSGEIVMSVWEGLDNGVPTADMSPAALAPTSDDQYHWPLWGKHFASQGALGQAPEDPAAAELLALYERWLQSVTTAERQAIWDRMLQIRAEQVFTIGTVNQSLQPIMRAASLRNVPDQGLFGFTPTAYLGAYLMDSFWHEASTPDPTQKGQI